MTDRERAKQIIDDAFDQIKGDIGKLARIAVPRDDRRAMIDLVEQEIGNLRHEILTQSQVSRATHDAYERAYNERA